MNIAFVILHYQTIEDTRACIKSIKNNIDTENYLIIVVDNGSPNQSGYKLKEEYINKSNIKVIINEENVGFARGHNIGIDFAKKQGYYDFIILLNNDTEIIGNNWVKIIEEKFRTYKFHVLGPDIISPNGLNHSNPVKRQISNITDLQKMIRRKKKLLLSNYLYIDPTIRLAKAFVKKVIKYKPKYQNKIEQDMVDVQLQGSCLILSELFFEKHKGLYDGTFLYFEEAILRYIADRDRLKMVYTPEISLLHKESRSTKVEYTKLRTRNIFYLENSLDSCLKLYEMMNNDLKTGD